MLNNGSPRVRQNPPSSQPFSPLQHWLWRKPPLAEVTTPRRELQTQSWLHRSPECHVEGQRWRGLRAQHRCYAAHGFLSCLTNSSPPLSSSPGILFIQFSHLHYSKSFQPLPHLFSYKRLTFIILYQSIMSQKVTGPEEIGVPPDKTSSSFLCVKSQMSREKEQAAQRWKCS